MFAGRLRLLVRGPCVHKVTTMQDLDEIRHRRELSAARIVAVARVGVAAVMIVASFVGLKPKWSEFAWVSWAYGLVAILAALLLFKVLSFKVLSFKVAAGGALLDRVHLVLVVIDVAAIFTFKVVSADGAYVPLLMLMLLPVMVVLDVSWRRATLALAVIVPTFAVEIFTDPVMLAQVGIPRIALATVVFVFFCCTVSLAVYAQSRQLDEIVKLSGTRNALLVDLMTASDEQQRKISEYIHDGPLQSVLMARQDIVAAQKRHSDESLDRALAGLREATDQMREATFELHPAVLGGAGLSRAITQLADAHSARSGIAISAEIEGPEHDATDPILFAVARELLANVVRHSQATRATLTLRAVNGVRYLDVTDDGIGISKQRAADRLTEGHIGLASQRTRIEAAGGALHMLASPAGTHIAVSLPMADTANAT